MSSACGCHHEGPLIPSTCIANPVFGVSLSWHDSIILSRGVEWIASMGPGCVGNGISALICVWI